MNFETTNFAAFIFDTEKVLEVSYLMITEGIFQISDLIMPGNLMFVQVLISQFLPFVTMNIFSQMVS